MMNMVAYWVVNIFMVFFILMIVVFNVARIVYFIKCFKVKDCSDRHCQFKMFCHKYDEVYTDEEIARILAKLEERHQNECRDLEQIEGKT